MLYSGKFGYAVSTEVRPGIWEDVITERDHLGKVEQRTEVVGLEDSVLPSLRTTTSISVRSDGAHKVTYANLRYVIFQGVRWSPSSVVVDGPNLTVFIGEVYNGPTPE